MNLQFLLWLITSLILIHIGTLIYLLWVKEKWIRREQKKEQFKPIIEKLVAEALFNENRQSDQITRHFKSSSITFDLLQEALDKYQQLFRNEATEERMTELAEYFLSEQYEQQLLKGNWSTRMNTLYFIEDFKMRSLANTIWMLSQSNSKWDEEKEQMIRTLAALQDKRLFDFLMEKKPQWSSTLYKEVLRRMNPQLFRQYVLGASQYSDPIGLAMLDVVREGNDDDLFGLFEELLFSSELEVRIRALKGIYARESISNSHFLIPFATSNEWIERMLFARIAGKLKQKRMIEPLQHLIGDTSWWVRRSAAESLLGYRDGVYILAHIVATHPDTYARDMAYQWLGEGVGDRDD
ncbi:hypothetical protein RYX56_02785 [Alkalihalophilus lindianensis]|uniref:HEAT repeat protein n=1 Tax=Alkalihalophilus lindianensis TaxID=1630542 RepID=A0ABU3X666_9BACI|nr:hypothetical protein [Alkalihalophilus lindianensis]MDV2683293.1 hypothetical protein [Alkalihalophilus lindianensis]